MFLCTSGHLQKLFKEMAGFKLWITVIRGIRLNSSATPLLPIM